MSGLNENPFADPFADPSVQQAAQTTQASRVNEEYNPFDKNNDVPVVNSQNPPPSSSSTTADDLFRQQEELRRKEQELQRRQQEFEQRQAQSNSGRNSQPHNWPPIPSAIPLEPCFYQDIEVEIPVQFQKIVRMVYHVYLIYVTASALNVIASLFYFLFGGGGLGIFFLSMIEMVLFSSCSYLFWFRPVYKAFRDDSSFNFMVFFFVLFFHSIFCFVQALGLSSYACGWTNGIATFSEHPFVGLIMIVSALGYTAAFLGIAVSLFQVYGVYRGAGANFSFDRARREFGESVMRDQNVSSFANQAASAAARTAVNQAVNQATQGRY
uniref:Secretory carrier-associated membrane protein n=1 Tax=Parastrongyloides trichosuri TaxID=131310 RepID=A0A0N4ZFK7_PARTI